MEKYIFHHPLSVKEGENALFSCVWHGSLTEMKTFHAFTLSRIIQGLQYAQYFRQLKVQHKKKLVPWYSFRKPVTKEAIQHSKIQGQHPNSFSILHNSNLSLKSWGTIALRNDIDSLFLGSSYYTKQNVLTRVDSSTHLLAHHITRNTASLSLSPLNMYRYIEKERPTYTA